MSEQSSQGQRIRLLSFNIQAGTATARYHHYVTQGWRQVLPHSKRVENLDSISELVQDYDLVALQEADSGSLRSGFVNQTRYVATHAGLPFWCHQSNRKVGTFAYAGNGLLSRYEPAFIEEHRLPGAIPGRGALFVSFSVNPETPVEHESLVFVALHLALGKRARKQQLAYLAEHLSEVKHLVVMGDMNTGIHSPELDQFCSRLNLHTPTRELASFPSWQPQRAIDHILHSESLSGTQARVLPIRYSDHCPVALELQLPAGIELPEASRPRVSIEAGI